MSCSCLRLLLGPVVLFAVPLLFGCREPPKRADVKGKVTYNGQRIQAEGLRVTFVGSDNLPLTAEVDANGEYTLAGVLTGENQVLVTCLASGPNPFEKGKPRDQSTRERIQPRDATKAAVPARYGQPEQSDLRFTVEAGKGNVFHVDLKD